MKYVFMCRGNGEIMGQGMLTAETMSLREHLRDDYTVIEVPWHANYGPVGDGNPLGDSYAVNLQLGIIMLKDMFQALQGDDTAILCGYSAGATLAGNYAALAAREPGMMYGHRIAGVGLVADPMRPYGGGTREHTPTGFGIGGQRDIGAHLFPVYWVSDPRDPIAVLPENSPLRTIADQTYAMSFAPGEFPGWMADLIDRLKNGRWQRVLIEWWNPVGVARQYAEAAEAAYRYLFGGDHTSYALRNVPGLQVSYLKHLADKLNGIHL